MKKLKPVFIEANDLDDAWFQLLWNLDLYGRRYPVTSGSHAGSDRIAFDYVAGFIHFPHTRPLAPQVPPESGVVPPTTDDDIEDYFVSYLMDGNLAPNEEYRYASWIVGTPGICDFNPIEWIIRHFQEHGYGNEHCYLAIGSPESNLAYDRPYKECPNCGKEFSGKLTHCPDCEIQLNVNEEKRGTSPCLRGLDFRIVDGMLTTHVIYRSWDLWGGFPVNMGGFTLLNEYVAERLEVEPGPLSFSCKSLHCYSHHIDMLKARLGKLQKSST